MHPKEMCEVIGGKRYDTKTATLIAGDDWWDGHNYERRGTNTFLYRTKKGNYFVQRLSQWEGAVDRLEPLTQDEAAQMWGNLPERRCSFEEAFPGVKIEEA